MRIGRGIIEAATFLVLAGCATTLDSDNAITVVPYSIVGGGRIVVDVHVMDEGPFRFAIDTGASISVIFDGLRDELGLVPDPENSVLIHGMVAAGEFPLLSVSHLQVGEASWITPRVASMPGNTTATANLDGILGIDFLQRYAVGFEAGERALRLYSTSIVSERVYRGWASIPLRRMKISENSAAVYLVDVSVGGRLVPALFDLGAGFNMLNWPAAHALELEDARPESGERMSGSLEETPVLARFVADEISIGAVHWQNAVFLVGDLGVFSRIGRENSPFVVIGSGLFSQRDFVIDFANNRLLVRRTSDDTNSLH